MDRLAGVYPGGNFGGGLHRATERGTDGIGAAAADGGVWQQNERKPQSGREQNLQKFVDRGTMARAMASGREMPWPQPNPFQMSWGAEVRGEAFAEEA